jgi:hypothetical protein
MIKSDQPLTLVESKPKAKKIKVDDPIKNTLEKQKISNHLLFFGIMRLSTPPKYLPIVSEILNRKMSSVKVKSLSSINVILTAQLMAGKVTNVTIIQKKSQKRGFQAAYIDVLASFQFS